LTKKKNPVTFEVRATKENGINQMLYENNKAYGGIVNGAPVPFLPLYAAQNGQRLNERKGRSIRLAKIYYIHAESLEGNSAEAMRKRAGRVFGCSSRRVMAIGAGSYAYNLYSHRCKDRSCTDCQRLRAFILQQKIKEITPELIAKTDEKDGLIFGTLTVKNPLITDLKDYLKILSKSFARLMRRKEFKQIAVGGFRCFEVTRGESGSDFCHPHIHFLLQVKASYFSRNSPFYIKSEDWAAAWTDCLKLETEKSGRIFNAADYPDGKAFVKILRVQAPDYTRENRKYATIGMLQNQDQIVNYVLKYTAKEDEGTKKALVRNDSWFFEYDKQIKNIRAISFFGIYKTLIAELPPREYNEEEIKTDLNNNQAKFYDVIWDDEHKYLVFETTEAQALEKKRFNMVKSAFNTLKVQLEIKNQCLLKIHTTYYNDRFLIVDKLESKETDQHLETISKQLNNNIFDKLSKEDKKTYVEKYSFNLRPLSFEDKIKINDEILNINEVSLRIYNTFKRLVKLGEVVEGFNGFEQPFYSYNFENKFFEVIPNFLEEEIKAIKERYLKVVKIVETDPPF